jgi:molecular chaperone DnaK (HSP70)
MANSRYIIGIDLGTTNSAVAYIDTQELARTPAAAIQTFDIPQLVSEGTTAARSLLPSFLYLPGKYELPPGSLSLPWDPERNYAVGEFARWQGTRVPGRLVSSAKSWLCHPEVNRTAPILPWGAPPEVTKLSPIVASSYYLQHMKEAWNHEMGKNYPLENQDIVLTVPASFDEVARELTVEAAHEAGLTKLRLLEEPQAALYAWLADHERDWDSILHEGWLVLVFDVGGGTTDFSLVVIKEGKYGLEPERIAVGDHLLLGGDNIDIALARQIESRLTGGKEKLDSQRWHILVNLCRAAKEQILEDSTVGKLPISVPGRGSALVGGAMTETLTRREVLDTVLDGFFPMVGRDDMPRRGRVGLQEWGLPYAAEPEISRHLADFLQRHVHDVAELTDSKKTTPGTSARPDAVLFNGGALKPDIVRERIQELIGKWFSEKKSKWRPEVLENPSLDLAVAHGAAYYGLVRRGMGLRITGGTARSYYIGITGPQEVALDLKDPVTALCLVPRGMEEGSDVHITEREFEVLANQPVSFPLYTSSGRAADKPGEIIMVERESLIPLPPIRTVLRFGKKSTAATIPVRVSAHLTEVGTLELWCESIKTNHRWRLQFQLRGTTGEAAAPADQKTPEVVKERVIVEPALAQATEILRGVYQERKAGRAAPASDPVSLTRVLEETLGYRKDQWPLSGIRKLWDELWELRAQRSLSSEHEARWLNLIGFCLRPGFGHPLDDWRVQQVWKIFPTGVIAANAVQARVEWWTMWKRVAGGLSQIQQTHLYHQVAPWLLPRYKSRIKESRSKVGPQEVRGMWQVVANCERLSADIKAELGKVLLVDVEKAKASREEIWSLARLGARALLYGPIDCVVHREVAEDWVERLLEAKWRRPGALSFALLQLARCVGDRERDLREDLRVRVAERLSAESYRPEWSRLVLEAVPQEDKERAEMFDESLPEGLRIVSG